MENVETNASMRAIELTWGGKLPSMGDFVWSNGGTPLRAQLENWLLTGMQQFRLTRRNNWMSSFDQAPMWNFIVPVNVLGLRCVAGCISPSCDRVGRRFPFVVTYGLSASGPTWYLSKAVNAIPTLLTQAGALLLDGIRRQWPKETLVSLIQRALNDWEKALTPLEQTNLSVLYNDSVILSVLAEKNNNTNSGDDIDVAPPSDRFSSLPWNNIAASLNSRGLATSFWWTNGAGGAPLKAFTYGPHLDGVLMTWLFGQSS